eukprot:366179-Chlamydomonas_euryale.AAC.1
MGHPAGEPPSRAATQPWGHLPGEPPSRAAAQPWGHLAGEPPSRAAAQLSGRPCTMCDGAWRRSHPHRHMPGAARCSA